MNASISEKIRMIILVPVALSLSRGNSNRVEVVFVFSEESSCSAERRAAERCSVGYWTSTLRWRKLEKS